MRWNRRWLLALAGLLAVAGAQAQQRLGGSGGSGGFSGMSSSGSSGFGGGSSGSSGSSSGGFTSQGFLTGSSGGSASGGFSGTSSGSSSGGFTGSTSTGRSGSSSYGTTSIVSRYYGSVLASGYGAATTGTSTSGTSMSRGTSGFGQPLVNTATLTRTTAGGSSGALGSSGLGSSGLGSSSLGTTRANGATSMGTRRAPQYLTAPGFAQNQINQRQQTLPPPNQNNPNNPNALQPTYPVNQLPAPTAVVLRREDLQAAIGRASRLPSRENINVNVGTDGAVVLRGTVGSERERRMAEATMRLSPGVREVRNELQLSRSSR